MMRFGRPKLGTIQNGLTARPAKPFLMGAFRTVRNPIAARPGCCRNIASLHQQPGQVTRHQWRSKSWERLFTAAHPMLKKFHAPSGSYVIKRYGKPGAKQDRDALGEQ
jgi:hypothetical protein